MNELIGKIAVIELPKRHLVVMDKDMILHPYTCVEPLDVVLQKQKVGYFVKISSEGDICKKIEFAPRPADWPFKAAGKPFVPRNDRAIAELTLIKTWTELYISTCPPDEIIFDNARDIILSAVEEDIDRVMKIGEQK
jgi:hypothetical protein